MTSKNVAKLNTKNNVKPFSFDRTLYNIKYPNCRNGIFSLCAPSQDLTPNEIDGPQEKQRQQQERNLTSNIIHPEYLQINQQNNHQQSNPEKKIQRDAEVQCSIITSENHSHIPIRRQQTYVTWPYTSATATSVYDDHDYDLSPRYRVQLQLKPVQPNVYEVWDIKTPPRRTIPINEKKTYQEPYLRIRSPRLVDLDSVSDDQSDQDNRLIYARYPSRTYLPGNVRMISVRQDTNTIRY